MGIFVGSLAILAIVLIIVGAMYLWVDKTYPPKEKRDE